MSHIVQVHVCRRIPIAESQYDVQTYGIYADFSLGAKVYQDVEDTLKDLEIGILGEIRGHSSLPSLSFYFHAEGEKVRTVCTFTKFNIKR